MALSDIKSIKVTESKLNPSGDVVFDNYLKSSVSNYGVSWVVNNDSTLNIFNADMPPVTLPGVQKIGRGYAIGGQEKKIVGAAYSASMPKVALDLTGVIDIDGGHVHGLALLNNNTITGWTMTGWVYPMGSKTWATSGGTLWNQSRLAATGGNLLTGVKKIGADFQASFALLSGDVLTGWGNMGETWINPGYSSVGRGPYVYFINEAKHHKDWRVIPFVDSGRNFPSGKWNFISEYGVASYTDQNNNSHLLGFGSYDQSNTLRPVSTMNYNINKWIPYWPDGIPSSSGVFSSFSVHNGLSIVTISGGKLLINSGAQHLDNPPSAYTTPFTGVEINGSSSRALVGSFIRVNPSYDIDLRASLFNAPSAANLPTSGFSHKTILLENQGDIWITSDNRFSSWTGKGLIKNWRGLAYSKGQEIAKQNSIRGKYMLAFTDNEYIYTSDDTGNTWTQKTSLGNGSWTCAAISSGGKYQIVGAQDGYIWKSNDYGQNWSQITQLGSKKWRCVSIGGPEDWIGKFDTGRRYISQDFAEGAYLVAIASGNNLWASYNYGDNWSEKLATSTFIDAGWVEINYQTNPITIQNVSQDWVSFNTSPNGGKTYILPKNGPMFHADNGEYPSYPAANYGKVKGYYTDYASPQIPFASYPNIYLTGVKDFDIGENYITILLNTGSNETFQLSGFGDMRPQRLRNDNLKEVKKVISNRDHSFAIIKSGNTSVITSWGLDESNLSQFEQFVWSFYGGVSGWFSGFRNDYKSFTGVRDIDIGYNHGIAIFEDDRVSGWGSEKPLYNKGLIGQINNKYKNVNEREINFFAPNYTVPDEQLFFKTDATDAWEFKYNSSLSRWVFEVNSLVTYVSKTPGIDGILGEWDGTGLYSGQKLSIANDTTQSVYPVEMGEAYISAIPDKDWIEVSTANVIFPWNKTVGYFGKGAESIDVFNLPSGLYYNQNHGPSTTTCSSNFGCPCDFYGELASFPTGNTILKLMDTYGASWQTGSISGNFSSIAISLSGKHQTASMLNGKIYVSNNTGLTWAEKEFDAPWTKVSMSKDGMRQFVIKSGVSKIWYSNDYGASWLQRGGERNWKNIFSSYEGDILFAVTDNDQIFSYSLYDNFGINEVSTWTEDSFSSAYPSYIQQTNIKDIAFDEGYRYISIVSSGGNILVTNDWGNTWQNKDAQRPWSSIAMSKNGQYQTATVNAGRIFRSSDFGQTWSSIVVPTRNWFKVDMSDDGKYQAAVITRSGFYSPPSSAAIGAVYYSKDYGVTWNAVNASFESTLAVGKNYVDVAVSHDAVNQVAIATDFNIIKSKVGEDTIGSVRLYPTKDYPLTVYREISGASSSDPVRFDKNYEVFLSQERSKQAPWSISLRYRVNNQEGLTSISEEKIVTIPRSIDKTGYAMPPSGNWPSFAYRSNPEPCAEKTSIQSGLYLTYSPILSAMDSRTGFMQDINFTLNYDDMLPRYSNKDQVYKLSDGYLNYSNFGANISVEDATKCHKVFNFKPILESNTSWAANVSRFSADSGVNWNDSVTKPNCSLFSSNIYGPINSTPPRSKSGNNWYILLKFFLTGWNFPTNSGSFNWPGASIIDRSSGGTTQLTAELFNPVNSTWSSFQPGQYTIASGTCYHYQIRLSHSDINVNSGSLDRNFWPNLVAPCYSGGYYWNNIEDEGSGTLSDNDTHSLTLQRGREYRFIQNGPINSSNRLRIHPAPGVEVTEYDCDNSSEYHLIKVNITSEDKADKFINWSKGDKTYITGFTGSHPNSSGSYIIGDFYEINSSGIIVDPSSPSFRKYPLNNFTGQWEFNTIGTNKISGLIKYQDKIYPAEFWRFSGGQSLSSWPTNLNNGSIIDTAYAFIKTGNTQIPFYGIMTQRAKNINVNAVNPSGNGRYVWNGRFKIVGKNEFSIGANYMVEYPSPGMYTPFDMHMCTDYNEANNPNTWSYLEGGPETRSGISYFSGVNSSGYFFKNRNNRLYHRKNILTQKNTINNIWFLPTTHARFSANELAFWTGSSSNGPWSKVNGEEASLWGGTSNYYNVNFVTYPDPSISEVFGELWQLIQFYIPSSANTNSIHIKIGPKEGDPNCLAQTGCRFTNISVLEEDGLPALTENGYYQSISGVKTYMGFKDYYNPSKPLFSGNLNIWSSDVLFKKQIPLGIIGPIDYIR